jgi:hypothetical protein
MTSVLVSVASLKSHVAVYTVYPEYASGLFSPLCIAWRTLERMPSAPTRMSPRTWLHMAKADVSEHESCVHVHDGLV